MTSHLNNKNKPTILNINEKKITERTAIAEGRIKFSKDVFDKIQNFRTKKGEITSVAILAGILGAKKTSDLIPLCHNINIENVDINIESSPKKFAFKVIAKVKTSGKTGVEMEALTAVSIACLTIYDMCKSMDKSIVIEKVRLIRKTGGKTDYLNP